MIAKQMEKLADILIEKEISKSEDKAIIAYGLCTGIELCFNIITTIVLGFLFGLVFESLVLLISFSFIRIFAGGYHCKKAINCYFFSSGIMVFVLSIVKFTSKEDMLVASIVILLISVPIILKFAPVKTEAKPLNEDEQNHYREKTIMHLCIECTCIMVIFFAKLHIQLFVATLGIAISAMLVLIQIALQRTEIKIPHDVCDENCK